MDDLYIIVANGARKQEVWEATFQFPTFFVQASSSEEAGRKADDILNHTGDIEVHMSVMKVS